MLKCWLKLEAVFESATGKIIRIKLWSLDWLFPLWKGESKSIKCLKSKIVQNINGKLVSNITSIKDNQIYFFWLNLIFKFWICASKFHFILQKTVIHRCNLFCIWHLKINKCMDGLFGYWHYSIILEFWQYSHLLMYFITPTSRLLIQIRKKNVEHLQTGVGHKLYLQVRYCC